MVMKTFLMVLFFLILLLLNTPMAIAQFSEAGVEQFKVAVNAPDFTLRKLGGGEISLKDPKGKIVILNFFATY
jgi:cytochrome oxidase Cu insertion factor (SCO1/SenC/PrrC family)